MQEQKTEKRAPKKTFLYARIERSDKPPKVVFWLLDRGFVKSYGGANTILVLMVIIFFGVGFWFAWTGNLFGNRQINNRAFLPGSLYNLKNTSSTSPEILPQKNSSVN